MPNLAPARVCLACPYCGTINAPHGSSSAWPCRKCRKEFASGLPDSFVEAKPDANAPSVDLPVRILGNEVPAWAVKLALGLASFVCACLVLLVGLRLANPDAFRSLVGAVSDVRTSIITTGSTIRFERNLTFFVPHSGDASAEENWLRLFELLKADGATGYTRWRVEGSGGDDVQNGYFVLLSLPSAGLDAATLKQRFHDVYGTSEAFFLIDEQLR